MTSDGHVQRAMELWRHDTAPANTQVAVTPPTHADSLSDDAIANKAQVEVTLPTHRDEPLSTAQIEAMDSMMDAVSITPAQLPTRADFQSLPEVVHYLNRCRPRALPMGDWSFEPRGEDRTSAVRSFFMTHHECQVSINGGLRFITLSKKAVERINAQLPEGVAKLAPQNPVIMAEKYR